MTREDAVKHLENMKWLKGYDNTTIDGVPLDSVIDGIIGLLKAQEPRVMTLEELRGIYNFRENHSWVYDTPPYLYLDNRAWIGYWVSWSNIIGCLEGQEAGYKVEKYGERWRCWTSRPTDEQREAVPWNAQK